MVGIRPLGLHELAREAVELRLDLAVEAFRVVRKAMPRLEAAILELGQKSLGVIDLFHDALLLALQVGERAPHQHRFLLDGAEQAAESGNFLFQRA